LVVCLFELRRGNISDGSAPATVVEPVDPVEGRPLDGFQTLPGAASPDDLGLGEADDRLGEGVVVAVADAPDGALDAGGGEAFALPNRQGRTPRSL
jgi:hypothetical protein